MMSVTVFCTGVIFLVFVQLGWPAMVDDSHSISYNDDDDIDDGFYKEDVFINSISRGGGSNFSLVRQNFLS